jgi:hypothetical protein
MVKKIILIALFILFAGVLIYGAVNRTTAISETANRIAGQNQAAVEHNISGNEHEPQSSEDSSGQRNGQGNQGQGNQGQGNQGQGNQEPGIQELDTQELDNQELDNQELSNQELSNQGLGNQGQSRGTGQGQGANQQREVAEIQERNIIEGVVVQAPAYGIDMILETAEGDVLIGTGPGYLGEQGFVILLGDSVSVTGFWEDEEFKAFEITLLADGTSIILRDEWGRPMWSGAGRNAKNLQIGQNDA